jgi:nucleotide-binding universal stress UspA family protein
MYNKILVPTDGSANAKRAGVHARWIADVSGADIMVLTVIEPYYPQISALPNFRESLYDDLRDEGRIAIETFKKDLEASQCKGICKNVMLTTKIKEGKPYNEILDTIIEENIDLVVMGASGRHGLDKFMIGSVTERVIRAANCPVMVVH